MDGLVPGFSATAGFLAALACRGGSPPRTILLVAHPDDEVIGAGARLGWLTRATLIHVTDGAPRSAKILAEHGFDSCDAYAAARREELERALTLAGFAGAREQLGLADQQAAFRLVDLATHLAHRLSRADIVLTHPYEGGHPDHDAAAFAVHAACRLLRGMGRAAPAVVEMAFYHAASGAFTAGSFLPGRREPVTRIALNEEEQELKGRLYACFATQAKVLAQFGTERELFRPAPAYDFTAPPHAGPAYYERFDWGIDPARFCALATEALQALRLEAAP